MIDARTGYLYKIYNILYQIKYRSKQFDVFFISHYSWIVLEKMLHSVEYDGLLKLVFNSSKLETNKVSYKPHIYYKYIQFLEKKIISFIKI